MTAVDLAYDDVGEGPVVVLIHGHPFNRSMWAPQLDALRERFRVIAPDLRGRAERPDYRPLLAALDTPSFVCVGDHDAFSTAAVTEELTGCLRDPHLVVLEGVGHLPNLERPGDFNQHLLGFLGSTRPQPG